jgi:hypothetical protein
MVPVLEMAVKRAVEVLSAVAYLDYAVVLFDDIYPCAACHVAEICMSVGVIGRLEFIDVHGLSV